MHRTIPYIEFELRLMSIMGLIRQWGNRPLDMVQIDHFGSPLRIRCHYYDLERLFQMASKKGKKTNTNFRQIEFVNFKFNAEMKAEFEAWFTSKGTTAVKAIYETLQSEHKLSLSYDADGETVIASMTGKEDSLNSGRCMTLRSADWFKALAACAYVHTVVFDGEVWNIQAETDIL